MVPSGTRLCQGPQSHPRGGGWPGDRRGGGGDRAQQPLLFCHGFPAPSVRFKEGFQESCGFSCRRHILCRGQAGIRPPPACPPRGGSPPVPPASGGGRGRCWQAAFQVKVPRRGPPLHSPWLGGGHQPHSRTPKPVVPKQRPQPHSSLGLGGGNRAQPFPWSDLNTAPELSMGLIIVRGD